MISDDNKNNEGNKRADEVEKEEGLGIGGQPWRLHAGGDIGADLKDHGTRNRMSAVQRPWDRRESALEEVKKGQCGEPRARLEGSCRQARPVSRCGEGPGCDSKGPGISLEGPHLPVSTSKTFCSLFHRKMGVTQSISLTVSDSGG